MSIAARVTRHQQLSYFLHTDTSGETWTLVKRGTATSNGAAAGTTLIDTNGDSGGADTYNGRYWVRCEDGDNKGMMRRIIDDDGSGTLTFEDAGFPHQIDSGDSYTIWQSPEPVIVVDSSTDNDPVLTVDIVDAVRNEEEDDFWVGYYVRVITGTYRGKIALITGYTKSSGTFVVENTIGGALSAGDVCLLRRYIEVEGPNDGTTHEYFERLSDRLTGSMGDGHYGVRGGTFGFSTHLYGSGSASAAGSEAANSVLGHLFKACGFCEEIGTSCDVEAAAAVGAITVDAGQWERCPIGAMVVHNNMPVFVESTEDGTPDIVNVTPDLPVAPDENDVLYGTRMYRENIRAVDGEYHAVGFEWEVDGIRTTITGCRGNVNFVDGAPPKLEFEFQVDHFNREVMADPSIAGDAYVTTPPIMTHDRLVYLDETASCIGTISCSLNNEVTPKNVQGCSGINARAGFAHVRTNPAMTFREILDATDELEADERWHTRTPKDVMIIYGSTPGSMFGIRIPVARIVEDPKHTDASGVQEAPNVMRAHDASTTTNGDNDVVKVPVFAFFIF